MDSGGMGMKNKYGHQTIMKIHIPEFSLIFPIGAAGSGKSTLARKHFRTTEILSSDHCRAMISDDENNQSVSKDAFEILYLIAEKRLGLARLTLADATNTRDQARKPLLSLARKYHCPATAIVLRFPESICLGQNRKRERVVPDHVIRQQMHHLELSLPELKKEGFERIFILETPEQAENIQIYRNPLRSNKKNEHGPFDIISDVRGCFEELLALMKKLGYDVSDPDKAIPPKGRKAVFIGDMIGAGPGVPSVLRLVMGMRERGDAFCILGDHEYRLRGKLMGKNIGLDDSLRRSVAQLAGESQVFQEKVIRFLRNIFHHYVFDDGKLVVAHAGMSEDMQGRVSAKVRQFALYGDKAPRDWAAAYSGRAAVVYGHKPVPEPRWLNRTINIDTGCIFGEKLTALRYPEEEIVSVPSDQTRKSPF